MEEQIIEKDGKKYKVVQIIEEPTIRSLIYQMLASGDISGSQIINLFKSLNKIGFLNEKGERFIPELKKFFTYYKEDQQDEPEMD
jgi:hypothetical protein